MPEITDKDAFGRAITSTVLTYRIYKVLEIGAFDGDGSTLILARSLRTKGEDRVRLTSLEYSSTRFANLKRNTRNLPFVEPVNKSSIGKDSFTAWDFEQDVWNSGYNGLLYPKQQVRQWHAEDVRALKKTQEGYLDGSQEMGPWDAVLLDGGEFAGYDEFRLTRRRTKCFLLDDAYKAFKNNRVCNELSSDPSWRLIHALPHTRNGAAIFVRQDLQKESLFARICGRLRFILKARG